MQKTLHNFTSPEEKARFLDGAARLDQYQRDVCAVADSFAPSGSTAGDTLVFMRRAHAFVRDHIAYRDDAPYRKGVERFADSSTILRRRFDDCDGKARAFVALCLSANRFLFVPCEAAIRPIFPRYDWFSHVQAAARIPGHRTGLEQSDGWIVAELCLDGVPLGSGLEAARYDDLGRPVVR